MRRRWAKPYALARRSCPVAGLGARETSAPFSLLPHHGDQFLHDVALIK